MCLCGSLFYSVFSSTAGLDAWNQQSLYYIGDWCVCVDVVKLYSNYYSFYILHLILMNLGTRDLCDSLQKNCGTHFWNFDLKFLADFFKILYLCLVSGTAADALSRPIGLWLQYFICNTWVGSLWAIVLQLVPLCNKCV